MDSPEINEQHSDEEQNESKDDLKETLNIRPELIFCDTLSQRTNKSKEGNQNVTFRRIEELHLCEKTRPRWLAKIDYDDEESPLDKEFPILPFSDESMEIYKKFRKRWKPNLNKDEKKILFGSDASGSSDEEVCITVLCDTCKPKILTKENEPKKRTAASLFKKLRNITLLKDSRSKIERKMKLERAEEVMKDMAKYQPRDILKDIMEEAINEVKQETNMLVKEFELPSTSDQGVTSEEDENLRDEWEEAYDEAEESDFSSDESEDTSTCFFAEEATCTYKPAESSTTNKSSDELIQKMYLKPEEPSRKYGKARYDNESTAKKEVNLLEKLDRNDLKELKSYFFPKTMDHQKVIMECNVKNEAKYGGIPFKKRNFMEAIDNIIGAKEYTLAAGKLFENLEANNMLKEGVLWWEQFLDLIIASGKPVDPKFAFILEEEDNITNFRPFSKSPIINIIKIKCNRELTYAALSRLGEVAVLDEKLNILHSYRIPINQFKSKKCCWLTDACYSPETDTLFVVASTRCLYLYNTSRIVHKLIQTVSGIWEIPECIYYTLLKRNQALILMGDNKGNILSFHFKQINKSYFKLAPDKDGEQYYLWDDIKEQTDWVDISIERKVHNDVILQLEYIPKSDCIISCSLDSKMSVAVRNRQPNRTPYIFVIEKGVKCFRFDQKLGVLATVSGDNTARLWDPVNTTRPLALLKGHKEPVLDVSLITSRRIAITYAMNKELKVWDIETFACLQTLILTFKEVPYTMHLLLNIRALYLDIRTDFKSQATSQTSSKLSTNESSSGFQYSSAINHLFVININCIKVLKINDTVESADEEVIFKSQISEEVVSERSENAEYNSEMELLEFIKNTFSGDNDQDNHKYFKGKKALCDFVKEGTPYLALKLQDVIDI